MKYFFVGLIIGALLMAIALNILQKPDITQNPTINHKLDSISLENTGLKKKIIERDNTINSMKGRKSKTVEKKIYIQKEHHDQISYIDSLHSNQLYNLFAGFKTGQSN